ncbi:hypothetical protein NDU88_003904, partial [Pleurodeles waltl]
LNFALRIIPMARPFSRFIARAMSGLKEKHNCIRPSAEVKGDLHIWASFLAHFNGAVIWPARPVSSETL